jgi:hypothetical protein
MQMPWDLNTRMRPKTHVHFISFKTLTAEEIDWIYHRYFTVLKPGDKKSFPTQKKVAELASKQFNHRISAGMVCKVVNSNWLTAKVQAGLQIVKPRFA